MIDLPENVATEAAELAHVGTLPAYVYDLAGLTDHAAHIRDAFAGTPIEVYYAAKGNPNPALLRTLAPYVAGVEVGSGGELAHVRDVLPDMPLAFGGPGKTPAELAAAAEAGALIHVESPTELARLDALGRPVDVLLRVNPPFGVDGAALAMGGGPTPFGMDPETLASLAPEAPAVLASAGKVRVHGLHTHVASGLDAPALLDLAARVLDWAPPCELVNLGGGMAVDYADPSALFDWPGYAKGLAALAPPGTRLRIEPGRAVTAYCGWYVTDVLDLKRSHGEWFAVLRGGTHHLRTPVTKGHDQPFEILRNGRAGARDAEVTLVGQLCTPKDVFARRVPVRELALGDVVAFAMAGAYAWNISHHDFLMHPRPAFRYLAEP